MPLRINQDSLLPTTEEDVRLHLVGTIDRSTLDPVPLEDRRIVISSQAPPPAPPPAVVVTASNGAYTPQAPQAPLTPAVVPAGFSLADVPMWGWAVALGAVFFAVRSTKR